MNNDEINNLLEDNGFKKEDLEELNAALEKGAGHVEPAIKVEDISKEIEPFLTDKAKKMLTLPKVTQLTGFENGKVSYVVRYFGVKTVLRSTGALKLAKVLNEIAEKYNPVGILATPIQVKLVSDSFRVPYETASAFYIALIPEEAVLAENESFAIGEGVMPNTYLETLEDIEEAKKYNLDQLDEVFPPDEPGTIHYVYKTYVSINQLPRDVDVEKEINRVLALLPAGTKHVSTRQLPVKSLCLEYHMKFHNEIFMDGAELVDSLKYEREVSIVKDKDGEGKLISFNKHNAFNFEDFVKTYSPKEDKYVTLKQMHQEIADSIVKEHEKE